MTNRSQSDNCIVEAFHSLLGRSPTSDEIKRSLSFMDVADRTGLDPFTLIWIANIKNEDEASLTVDRFVQRLEKLVPDATRAARYIWVASTVDKHISLIKRMWWLSLLVLLPLAGMSGFGTFRVYEMGRSQVTHERICAKSQASIIRLSDYLTEKGQPRAATLVRGYLNAHYKSCG